jgi:hypothetical protein
MILGYNTSILTGQFNQLVVYGGMGPSTSCVLTPATLTLFPPVISVTGNTNICLGSAANFTASGASSYTWNAYSWASPVNTPTISDIPLSGTGYTVTATYSTNSCTQMRYFNVYVDALCADVWPGDANRDGVVSTTDVLELGLAANATGAARSATSIAWASQYATAWTGTVSTGWDLAHADCNGDGVVNSADNAAITANFSMTHSFRSAGTSAANPEISLLAPATSLYIGEWNKVDIIVGDAQNQMSNLYGIAFEVSYDQAAIEPDSLKIIYNSSFLDAGNQNITFQKAMNNKLYAASVRTDHAGISGNGKIGEVWFKTKSTLTDNSPLQLQALNAQKVTASGIFNTLTNDAPLTVNLTKTALKENTLLEQHISLYPNPANDQVFLSSTTLGIVEYSVFDISGRKVLAGHFADSKTLDISPLAAGTYVLKFEQNGQRTFRKLVVE